MRNWFGAGVEQLRKLKVLRANNQRPHYDFDPIKHIDTTKKELHDWMKCPVCENGLVYNGNLMTGSLGWFKCDVCNGEKIISRVNGKPPSKQKA